MTGPMQPARVMVDPTPEAEQLVLFDSGVDEVRRLKERRSDLVSRAGAPATEKAYAADWRDFTAWCNDRGRRPLPAGPETIELYLVDLAKRAKVATLVRRLSAIKRQHAAGGHANPVEDGCRKIIRELTRERGSGEGKAALTVADIKAILKALRGRSARNVRNRALILFGFASGLRRSEISGLDVGDVRFSRRGVLVHLVRSKTDQNGKGRDVGIFRGRFNYTCPVLALQEWLSVRGRDSGPLFVELSRQCELTDKRLHGPGIWRVVRQGCEAAGLDASLYGAHSLRAGCVTAAAERGASTLAIMQRTGHRSVEMVARYVRPTDALRVDVLAGAL